MEKLFSPLCSQQGPTQLHITLQPGLVLEHPQLRNQHLRGRPSRRRGSGAHLNSLPAWHSGTAPLIRPILPELCSSHQPLHSSCAQLCSPKLPKPFLSHHPGPARRKPLLHFAAAKLSQTGNFQYLASFQLQAQVLLPQRFSSPSHCLRHGAQGLKGHKWLVRTAVPDSAIQSQGRSREVIFSLAQAKRDTELPPKAAAGSWRGAPCHELFPSQLFDFPAFPGSPAGPGESALPQSVPQECPTSTASCHCQGAIAECWGTPSPWEEPHTSTLECVLLERCGTGETATPNWRPRELEAASEEEESR